MLTRSRLTDAGSYSPTRRALAAGAIRINRAGPRQTISEGTPIRPNGFTAKPPNGLKATSPRICARGSLLPFPQDIQP